MSKPAVALARTQFSTDTAAPASAPAQFRDFSQPWLDLNDKSVLVTGGTGSFGKHFLKTVLERYKPRRVIIFSRDELKQFEMAHGLPDGSHIPSSAISSATCAIATGSTWRCATSTMWSTPPP